MSNNLIRTFLYHVSILELQTLLPTSTTSEDSNFVAIAPADNQFYRGALATTKETSPVVMGAVWYSAPATQELTPRG